MSMETAIISAASGFIALTAAIMGFLILRALSAMDEKMDMMISKNTVQDMAISDLKTLRDVDSRELKEVKSEMEKLKSLLLSVSRAVFPTHGAEGK